MKFSANALLFSSLLATASATSPCGTYTIDFTSTDFDPITKTYASNVGFGVTVEAKRRNCKGDLLPKNRAMIFDTNAAGTEDEDLEVGLGPALIIGENNKFDELDDNACGGVITFSFPSTVTLESITLIDIDDNDDFGPRGPTYLAANTGDSFEVPPTGNKNSNVFNLDWNNVLTLDVELGGSGAIPELVFDTCPPSCPDTEVIVGCAKCGQILECYVDADGSSVEYGLVEAYLNSMDFCPMGPGADKTPGDQQCNQQQGLVVDEVDDIFGFPNVCPEIPVFQCKAGAGNGGAAALSNWNTYKFLVDCNGVAALDAFGTKCDTTGVCGCDFGGSVFCSAC